MLSTLLVIGGVLVGLLVLLALIVSLSSRGRDSRGSTTASRGPRTPGWVADAGRPHPDTWGPLSNTSTEIRAIR
jgi:hypothetical protein